LRGCPASLPRVPVKEMGVVWLAEEGVTHQHISRNAEFERCLSASCLRLFVCMYSKEGAERVWCVCASVDDVCGCMHTLVCSCIKCVLGDARDSCLAAGGPSGVEKEGI
jgi:hypothetical protein